jgi:hypothetical protein
MADLPGPSRRTIGVALCASAGFLLVLALVIYSGFVAVGSGIKDVVASVLGAVAVMDLLLGLWFFRSSLSS